LDTFCDKHFSDALTPSNRVLDSTEQLENLLGNVLFYLTEVASLATWSSCLLCEESLAGNVRQKSGYSGRLRKNDPLSSIYGRLDARTKSTWTARLIWSCPLALRRMSNCYVTSSHVITICWCAANA